MKIAKRGAIVNQHAPIISNKRKEGMERLKNMSDEEITDMTDELIADFDKEKVEQEQLEKARVEKLIEIAEEIKVPCSTCGAEINENFSSSYHL